MSSNLFEKARNYFHFAKAQQSGLIVLIVLLIILFAIHFSLPFLITIKPTSNNTFSDEVKAFTSTIVKKPTKKTLSPYPFDPNIISKPKLLEMGLSDHQADMIIKYRNAGGKFYKKEDVGRIYSISDDEYKLLKPYIVINQKTGTKKFEISAQQLNPVPFDPNKADANMLKKLGLSQKQVNQIIGYRNAGGIFKKKNDFKKIYSISDVDYALLEKYILLPSVDSVYTTDTNEKPILLEVIEINSADTTELLKLKGIGPVYAQRIVSYRSKLGGFYEKSQLLEIFGIDTNRYVQFVDQIILDRNMIKKIEINNTGFKDLLSHPYLEFYIVKSIFNYKDAVGKFDSIAELKQIDLIYDQLYNKIEPYLSLNKTIN